MNLIINHNSSITSCNNTNDGIINVFGVGGSPPYMYSLDEEEYENDSIFSSLSNGSYTISIIDSNSCQISDTVIITGPESILPDTLWFNDITSSSIKILWQTDSLVDGYKFRYRMVGDTTWQGQTVVASGIYSDGIADLEPYKQLNSLNPATTYELQVKVNPIYDCDEEGWSTEIYYFTTKIGDYSYNVVNTCFPNNDGQIDFEIEPENSYVFNWTGPDGFNSNNSSIDNLFDGYYSLQILNSSEIIFDTIFYVDDATPLLFVEIDESQCFGDSSTIYVATELYTNIYYTKFLLNSNDSIFYQNNTNNPNDVISNVPSLMEKFLL